MSSESESQDKSRPSAHELLGLDPSAPADGKLGVSYDKLKKALSTVYEQGLTQEHSRHAANDPELFFWQLMDSLPDNVYFKDLRSRFTCINRAQARFLGVDEPNDAIGKSDFDYFPEELAHIQFREEQEIINSGEGYRLHEERHMQDNNVSRCMLSSKEPLRDASGKICGTFGISRDITSRFFAEREVERQRNLLEAIIKILPCRIFVRDQDSNFIIVNDAYQKALGIADRNDIIGRNLKDFFESERVKQTDEEDARIRAKGESILNQIEHDKSLLKRDSWIVTSKVPLRGPDMSIEGIVGMTYDITERKEAEQEARRLSEQLQEKNNQFEAELLLARQLQETLVSMGFDANRRFSQTGAKWNIEASYYYMPSRHLAGDFFDLIPISDSKLGILVSDVMGQGVKAALVTMLLRGLVAELSDLLDRPGKLLGQLNKRLCSLAMDQEFPRFTTAVYLTLDLDSGTARIANAGHPPPLWKTTDADGTERFEACPCGEAGPALGLIPDQVYQSKEFACEDTTEFLLFTDGIIRQKDAVGAEFGTRKLEELLLNNENFSLAEQLRTIESALRLTAGSKEFDDDICIVAAKLQPKQAASEK